MGRSTTMQPPDRVTQTTADPLLAIARAVPRLFIAVPLSQEARAAIERLVDETKETAEASAREPRSPVRWVRMDGLHLTLRFLGPTEPEQAASLPALLDLVAAGESPFAVTIRRAGAFPSPRRPRTLWLGIGDGEERLAMIAQRLATVLTSSGWPLDERPFRPHLTLARADGRREGPAVAEALVEQAQDFSVSFAADRLVLFESLTGGGPARYVQVHEARFRG